MTRLASPATTISRPNTSPGPILGFPSLVGRERLDFASERAVFSRHVTFDVGKAPVDVFHARTDIARGTGWRCSDALPELLGFAVLELERAGLGRSDPAGNEINREDRARAQEQGRDHADPDQGHVEAGIIGDAGANPH